MEQERRAILSRVAAGELSPEEAARLLDELGTASTTQTATEESPVPPYEPLATGDVQKIRIVRSLGSARVVGDPSVREAIADGPHRAERQGGVLVIHSDFDDDGGFVFSRDRWRNWWQWDRYRMTPLDVRMSPDLPLELQAQGGSMRITDVHGPISGEVQAGSLTIAGVRRPLDLTVQAGNLKVNGVLASGSSHIRAEAGGIQVHLERGSSVRVRAHSTMGHISLAGQKSDDVVVVGGGRREVVVGDGEAELDLEATMGSIRVTTA
jgi:hypothetical protein